MLDPGRSPACTRSPPIRSTAATAATWSRTRCCGSRRWGAGRLALPPDRTAGDELQLITDDAEAALDILLTLARAREWSVGLGIGDIRLPLPDATRAAAGSALIRAREAVEAAKKRAPRVAVGADPGLFPDAATLQAVLDLLLQLRERRSPEGWELFDLVEGGLSQADAAARLDISPQAASSRALAAGIKLDLAARAALIALLAAADETSAHPTERTPS